MSGNVLFNELNCHRAYRTRGIGEIRFMQQQEYFEEMFLCLNSLSVVSHWHHHPLLSAAGQCLTSSGRDPRDVTNSRATSLSLKEVISQSGEYLILQVSQSMLQNHHLLIF